MANGSNAPVRGAHQAVVDGAGQSFDPDADRDDLRDASRIERANLTQRVHDLNAPNRILEPYCETSQLVPLMRVPANSGRKRLKVLFGRENPDRIACASAIVAPPLPVR